MTFLGDLIAAIDAGFQQVGLEINALRAETMVDYASTANLTLSGQQTVDTQLTTNGNLVLAKNQTTPSQNGIYVTSSTGPWARAARWNSTPNIARRGRVRVASGNRNAGMTWETDWSAGDALGVTGMNWFKVGPLAVAKYRTPQRPTVADFSIPTGVDTRIRWTSTDYSDPTFSITNPNVALNGNGRIFLGRPGWYRVKAQITFASSATGDRNLIIYNAAGVIQGYDSDGGHAGQGTSLETTCWLQITNADIAGGTNWFDTSVNQNSGGALGLFGVSAGFSSLTVEELTMDSL